MAKFKRKMISLETKIQILDRLKTGQRSGLVAKHFELNEATVRTIRKNEEKIRACVAAGSPLSMKRTSYARDTAMELMEKALILWIEDNMQNKMPIDGIAIRQKAVKIFNNIKAKQSSSSAKTAEFSGSKGWFEKFKRRFSLHHIKMREAASADETEGNGCPKQLHKTQIDIYSPNQVLNRNKKDVLLEKMPHMTCLSQAEQSAVGLIAFRSSCRMKPILIDNALNGCRTVLNRHNLPILENECYIPSLENEYSKITRLPHSIGEEECDDMDSNELEEQMTDTELNAAELVETVIDSVSNKCERVPQLTASIVDKGLAMAKELENFFVANDQNVERSLKFQKELYNCLAPYKEIYEELKNDRSQSLITDFYKKVNVIPLQNQLGMKL